MNKLTDMDWGWWPFIFLRPKKTENMTSILILKMSIYYGLSYGVLSYFITIPSDKSFNIIDLIIFILILIVVFFLLYKFSFAYYWNRRANTLRADIHFVNCSTHGRQDETFVCKHIVQTLEDGQPRGFHHASSNNIRPDAWCNLCNTKVEATNWKWTDENEEFADIQLLCALCYDKAKEINLKNV